MPKLKREVADKFDPGNFFPWEILDVSCKFKKCIYFVLTNIQLNLLVSTSQNVFIKVKVLLFDFSFIENTLLALIFKI